MEEVMHEGRGLQEAQPSIIFAILYFNIVSFPLNLFFVSFVIPFSSLFASVHLKVLCVACHYQINSIFG